MRPRRVSTRLLLITAAFGAVGALILVLIAPVTTALAVAFPPAYALVAGVHSILPFLARRVLGWAWAATLVGVFVGVLSSGFTVLGLLIVIPLVLSGFAFDVTLNLFRRRRPSIEAHYVVAAAVSAAVLFLVSLPVMSAEDLRPAILLMTFAGRVLGQFGASALSAVIARRVDRAGILPG